MTIPPRKLDLLRRIVREDPGSRLFLGLAEELMRNGEPEEALQVLEAGLAARPGQVAPTVARARCLVELGRLPDAWQALEPVLARDPTHLVAAKLAVELWLRMGDARSARERLDRYAPLGAADPDLVRLRARVRELEQQLAPSAAAIGSAPSPLASAAPAFPEAAPPGEDDEVVTVTLGNLYLLQGHRAEAERIFRRILQTDPDNRAARQALARVVSSGAVSGGRQDI